MTVPDTTAVPRGRPRDAAVGHKVVETVLRLIADGTTFGDLTMEGIAREAGVGKATVYRRWASKDALLLDAMAEVDNAAMPVLPGTSFRDDLVVAVETIRRRGLAKRDSAMLRNMLTQVQSNPELWQRYHETVIAKRRAALARLIEHGVATGEVRSDLGSDLELLVDFVTGPMLTRTAFRHDAPLEAGLSERIVDLILHGIAPPA
ncbi:TetR/AcrR family transcriptional regulator [Actinacidiphila bryophytorum]|uniref:TetR/AcrR family transcriptional regulator n=1 Tax=Actinacidiphila bryophytorum TaxID=1436133 RepID=UPI002176B6B0|nr:TetR/AcrR family transcriptional regulator [Actinacidiphila bryophytorum]UWE08777.1 TetR/AcrR family transcriptional regulator [Actinacidiphila bryophytorum]